LLRHEFPIIKSDVQAVSDIDLFLGKSLSLSVIGEYFPRYGYPSTNKIQAFGGQAP
jgi:hypothetical protein